MRRSWYSTEFYLTLALVLLILGHFQRNLTQFWALVCLNSTVLSYVLCRTFLKKNRGQFITGFATSEFWLAILAILFNFYVYSKGFDPLISLGFITGQVVVYNLCRGFAKSIGVKTNYMIR
jgi:hypothetical protein